MASNKLFEAAADILAGSKSSAIGMPSEKLPGQVVDAGGPTPQNYKSTDDSAKINPSDGAPGNARAPTTKPSDASPDTQEMLGGGQKTMKEDIADLFADDDTISEEFKDKVSTIFEARIHDRVSRIEEEVESYYAGMLEEAVESIKQDLTEKVDDYLSYIVEQWMEENQIAIESGLRSEMTEDFIAGLRNLFVENYIDVPAEKVDLVEELASKVEELESKLDEEIERNVDYAKALVESRKSEITREVCEGLTSTQVEKIRSLAESVYFSTEEEYESKLETIRENYFPSGIKKARESHLQEEVTDGSEKGFVSNDPFVSAVANAISKTKI